MVREKSAGAVIFRKEGKEILYLLLHHHFKTDYWDFPKGNIETGENERYAVKREIEEETGISDVDVIDGFREKINYFYKREEKIISKEVVYYLVETKMKEVKISEEHIGFKWVDSKTAKELVKPNSRKIIEKVEEFLKGGLRKFI